MIWWKIHTQAIAHTHQKHSKNRVSFSRLHKWKKMPQCRWRAPHTHGHSQSCRQYFVKQFPFGRRFVWDYHSFFTFFSPPRSWRSRSEAIWSPKTDIYAALPMPTINERVRNAHRPRALSALSIETKLDHLIYYSVFVESTSNKYHKRINDVNKYK